MDNETGRSDARCRVSSPGRSEKEVPNLRSANARKRRHNCAASRWTPNQRARNRALGETGYGAISMKLLCTAGLVGLLAAVPGARTGSAQSVNDMVRTLNNVLNPSVAQRLED